MMMQLIFLFMLCFVTLKSDPYSVDLPSDSDNDTILPTRRILGGRRVYLRPAKDSSKDILEGHWICGGVIIDARHILTSAACIEDAKHFLVVSGTHEWHDVDVNDNKCIINGAKRAVSKLVPKSYYYDGQDFDNIRWMVGDIAVVKVEDEFNFERRILGCDFIPKKIDYNNYTRDYEKSGTVGSIAGWGSTEEFMDLDKMTPGQPSKNSVDLLETDVVVVSKKGCKNHWDQRYHSIIDQEMICSKDVHEELTSECLQQGICKEIEYSDSDYYEDDANRPKRRMEQERIVHTAAHQSPTRRRYRQRVGGFCENDHGGPLVVGQGRAAVVIGIMSACLTRELTHKCRGPFLYTSVFKYRNLVACAIGQSRGSGCKYLLRSENSPIIHTNYRWEQRSDDTPKKRPALRENIATETELNTSTIQQLILSTTVITTDTPKHDNSTTFLRVYSDPMLPTSLSKEKSQKNESGTPESQRIQSETLESGPSAPQRVESKPSESHRVELKSREPKQIESRSTELLWPESVSLEKQHEKSGQRGSQWVKPKPFKARRFQFEPSESTWIESGPPESEIMQSKSSKQLGNNTTDPNANDGGIKRVMMRRYFRRAY